jgi:hypothetical protein
MVKKFTSCSTSCRATVLAYSGDKGTGVKEVALSNILNFYYQKGINAPYGEFSLEIPNAANYYKLFTVGDWVGIYLNNGIDQESLRCLGNISRIQKRVAIANDGTKTTTWQLFGYDYGKFLQTYKIFADPQILQDQIFQYTVVGNKAMLIGSSSELIRSYINKYLLDFSDSSYGTLIAVPDGFKKAFLPFSGSNMRVIYDLLNLNKIQSLSREATINLTLNVLQPLWTILKTLSNSIVNELFLEMDGEVGKEEPTVFLRPYPFSFQSYSSGGEYNNKFLKLPIVSVVSGDVLEQNLGLSDAERQNLFKIYSNVVGTTLGASVQLRAEINADSVERYGPCYATYTTSFADHGQSDPASLLKDWTGLLEHWYLNNHKLENGIISINGNPSVRVGKRLDIKGLYKKDTTSKSYYIEGYVDQWQFPGIWTQTLQLNRGVVVSGGKEFYVKEFSDDESIESSSVFEDAKMRR